MESLGRLAGGVVHDLNNILVVLINCSAFLKDFIDGAPAGERRELAREDVASIMQATAGAQRLARQLLAFGRRHRPAPEVLDANEVVTETAQLLRRVLEENIAFEVRLDDDVPPVELDRGQLEQVLINLVLNSRDAMPDGGRLVIATAPSAGGGLLITVADSGAGIAEEIRARIFEPFFTTKGPERGTGLGLSTVNRVVQEAHGAITVASRIGQGTTFSIELPRSTGPLITRRPSGDHFAVRRGEQVLLVEDDAAVRGAVARVLRRAGHGVREAATAAQAMERAREGGIELLVTDVILPDRSGCDLVRDLRELSGAVLPVLYMTGYAPTVDLAPGDGLLPKPFTPERLLECVAEVLAAQRPVERRAEIG
jgi:CheY-like chemotaxis protein